MGAGLALVVVELCVGLCHSPPHPTSQALHSEALQRNTPAMVGVADMAGVADPAAVGVVPTGGLTMMSLPPEPPEVGVVGVMGGVVGVMGGVVG
eukprot:3774067-Pyramimonas_sp.AAC.1